MNSFKIWLKTSKGKEIATSIISVTITVVIMLIIFLPLLLRAGSNNESSTMAYNRDSTSGTREAFENTIGFNSDIQQFSKNVLTVSSNDDMIKKVKMTPNSIGYVSLFSILSFDEQTNTYNVQDGLQVLSFEGINPIDDIKNDMQNYKAKRYFNVFFRVDSKYNSLISDNLFNSSAENMWDGLGQGIVDQNNLWSNFKTEYDLINKQNMIDFVFSFIFFNWMLFSTSVDSSIDISLSEVNQNFQSGLVFFLSNVYSLNSEIFNVENVGILTLGSTSVITSLNKMKPNFILDVNKALSELGLKNMEIIFEPANTGSSEAFKKDPNGSDEHYWLGFQSRSPKIEETQNYNQTFVSDVATPGVYQVSQNTVYASFEIDAIAFILKEGTTINVSDQKIEVTGITSLGANMIYTSNSSFEEIYKLGLLSGNII